MANDGGRDMLSHMVYFTLKEPSDTAVEQLVAACHTYLKDHPGIVFFAAGTRVEDLQRPVNDQEFHVGLHVVFDSRAAHDAYQVHELHQRFIAENQADWEQVRVFDAMVS